MMPMIFYHQKYSHLKGLKIIIYYGLSEQNMNYVSAENGKIVIKGMEAPKLNNGDILVKMRACSICGSDLEKVYGSYGSLSQRLGHEIAGEVAESRNNEFKKGDRVFVHHHVPCYECFYCRREEYTLCGHYLKSNVEPCGLAEYIRVPEFNVKGMLKLPESMSYEEAALIEPLACCIKSVKRLNAKKNDTAAIIGCGPVGMMHAMLLKPVCKEVFSIDINDYRLGFARKYSKAINSPKEDAAAAIKENTEGRGADVVIVATGNINAMMQAFELVRKGGKIMLFGVPSKGTMLNVDANKLFMNEISILTSGYCSEVETKEALGMIKSGQINAKELITHRYPLEKAAEAFAVAHKGTAMKVVVTNDNN